MITNKALGFVNAFRQMHLEIVFINFMNYEYR